MYATDPSVSLIFSLSSRFSCTECGQEVSNEPSVSLISGKGKLPCKTTSSASSLT